MDPKAEARVKASIVEMEAANKRARELIDKSRRAGLDVAEQERKLADLEAKAQRMRAVFIEGK